MLIKSVVISVTVSLVRKVMRVKVIKTILHASKGQGSTAKFDLSDHENFPYQFPITCFKIPFL